MSDIAPKTARPGKGRQAIVHIGMPKTGTTSIQNWLTNNTEALAQSGLHYGRVPLKGLPYHHSQIEYAICSAAEIDRLFPDGHVRSVYKIGDLAAQADFAKRFSQGLDHWLDKTGATKVVISSEHIGASTHNTKQAEGLDRWLRRHFDEVSYVVYFRRQEDWILSLYSQTLRFGNCQTMDEFITERKAKNYNDIVNIWEKAVGKERLTVRLMERDVMKNGDLYEDFAEIIGTDPSKFTLPERLNEAFSVEAAELLRQFNVKIAEAKLKGRLDGFIWNVVNLLGKESAKGHKLRLSPDQVELIRKTNAASNERLRASRFPERATLFEQPPLAVTADAYNTPDAIEMARLGAEIADAVRAGKIGARSLRNAPPEARRTMMQRVFGKAQRNVKTKLGLT
ncbi:hypothetical protein ACXN5S_17110 [Pseudoroseicyclus sp. H15]